jgi:hypothetical protein
MNPSGRLPLVNLALSLIALFAASIVLCRATDA